MWARSLASKMKNKALRDVRVKQFVAELIAKPGRYPSLALEMIDCPAPASTLLTRVVYAVASGLLSESELLQMYVGIALSEIK